jgi:hypothetical protein
MLIMLPVLFLQSRCGAVHWFATRDSSFWRGAPRTPGSRRRDELGKRIVELDAYFTPGTWCTELATIIQKNTTN